jgi:hypothetical protein
MPTYRLSDPSPYARTILPPRELMCESCRRGLGAVVHSDARSSMTADDVIDSWPFLDRVIHDHERDCSTP